MLVRYHYYHYASKPDSAPWTSRTTNKDVNKDVFVGETELVGRRHRWRGTTAVTIPSWWHIWGRNTALPRHSKHSWWRMRKFVETVVAETNLYLIFPTQSPLGKAHPPACCGDVSLLNFRAAICVHLSPALQWKRSFTLRHTPTPLIPSFPCTIYCKEITLQAFLSGVLCSGPSLEQ